MNTRIAEKDIKKGATNTAKNKFDKNQVDLIGDQTTFPNEELSGLSECTLSFSFMQVILRTVNEAAEKQNVRISRSSVLTILKVQRSFLSEVHVHTFFVH